MPKNGNFGSRAPKGASAGRSGSKPGAKSNFKPREDGRGGRAPHRQERSDARPESRVERPARRGAFFEGARDDRGAARTGDTREMRGGREDRGRDWQPREEGGRKPRHSAVERQERGRRDFGDRNDRPARPYGERSDRPARPYGERSDRPARDDRAPRRDYDDRAPRRDFGDRNNHDDRNDRPARPYGERSDRPARTYGERSDRPARDDRAPRRDYEDRGPRRDFGDRPRFGDRNDRRPDRGDRVERDNSRQQSFDRARNDSPNKKAFFEDVVLEKLESVSAEEVQHAESFEAMGLHPRLVTALTGMGAETPFPIQAATIPVAIEGRDVLGRGKTGSGKTIAFAVPIISMLANAGSQPRKPNRPRALILAPTRELADQIDRTASALARSVGFYTTCIYGGVPQRRQEIAMSRGVDILVATPGRLEDLMAQRIVDLQDVQTVVIDEADHMCDLGFIEGVKRILRATGDSQKLLFSATLDREIDALVREFLPNPFTYEVPNEEQETSDITHRVLTVDPDDRSQVLLRLVQGEGKALIFTRTKMTAERLAESLTTAGVPAARLHGDLNQNQRTRNLERFTRGQVRVMVATDVAARGIHVDDVALVIQVDPPEEYKTYLHRSGRTGRAGKAGTVVTLIPRNRRRRVEDLLRRAERDGIFTDVWPGHELLEQLAGPIAPPPVADSLDFGDSRGSRGDRDGRGSRGDRGSDRGDRPRRGNYGGNGKGRWADRPSSEKRPRAKKYEPAN